MRNPEGTSTQTDSTLPLEGTLTKLLREWEAAGLVTTLAPELTAAIAERIHQQMEEFRLQFARQQHQSHIDTGKIILNA